MEANNVASEDQPDQELSPNNPRESTFYESDEWNTLVDNLLGSFDVPQRSPLRSPSPPPLPPPPSPVPAAPPPPPQLPSPPPQEQAHGSSQMDQDQFNHQIQQINHDIQITSANIAKGNFFFSYAVSQSTMNQSRGSNACTFISLYLAKAYHMNY